MIRKGLYILLAVVVAMMAGGCASDLPGDASAVGKARFAISAVANDASATRAVTDTRAVTGTPADPTDSEKINSWWMVFVQSNGTVYKILDRADANPGLGTYTDTTPVEQEYFECDLPRGTYTVYAFANITPDELKSATGISFEEGATPSGVGSDGVDGSVWNPDLSLYPKLDLNLWEGNVPMSGFKTITVKNTIEETFSIEVVRMVAKIDFQFTNKTTSQIAVNSVWIKPIPKSTVPVSLMPDYDCLGNYPFSDTPLADGDYFTLEYKLQSAKTLDIAGCDDGSDKGSVYFYCKESATNTPTDLFTVGVNITRTKDGVNYKDEEILYSPTYQITTCINRNDWIVIPIVFTDWIVDFDVLFYPPIGGYPAVMREDGTDGESHYFTFASQGKFVITPRIKRADNDNWLQPDEYLSSMVISTPQDISGDGAAIFSTYPAVDPDKNPYEIIGELKDQITDEEHPNGRTPTGMAMIEISFTPKSEPGVASQKVTRRLYIIRK